LDEGWTSLQSSWAEIGRVSTIDDRMAALHGYVRLTLSVCRSMRAQFDVVLMAFGAWGE
jgi:hypothetical protein